MKIVLLAYPTLFLMVIISIKSIILNDKLLQKRKWNNRIDTSLEININNKKIKEKEIEVKNINTNWENIKNNINIFKEEFESTSKNQDINRKIDNLEKKIIEMKNLKHQNQIIKKNLN